MAKIIRVGYGSDGRAEGKTGGYLYVVDANLKKNDVIFPSVVHYQSGKIFGTTGKVLSVYSSEDTAREYVQKVAKQKELQAKVPNELAQYVSYKQAGIGTARGTGGVYVKSQSPQHINGEYVLSSRDTALKGANVSFRLASRGNNELTSNAQSDLSTYANYPTQRSNEL